MILSLCGYFDVKVEVKGSRTIRIVGNIFDHAQEKVFVDILPTFETTLVEFVNNTFHQFEDGFLKLPTSLSSSFGKLHFSNLVLQVRYDAKNVTMKVTAVRRHCTDWYEI